MSDDRLGVAGQNSLKRLIESHDRTVNGVLAAAERHGIGQGTLETLSVSEAFRIAAAVEPLLLADTEAGALAAAVALALQYADGPEWVHYAALAAQAWETYDSARSCAYLRILGLL